MPKKDESTVTIDGVELPATEENLKHAADLLANEALYDDKKEPEDEALAEEPQEGGATKLHCMVHGDFNGETCPDCAAETPEEEIKKKRSIKELVDQGIAIRASGILKDCSIKKDGQTLSVKNMRLEHNPYKLIDALIQNEEAVHIIIVPMQARLFEHDNPEKDTMTVETDVVEPDSQDEEPEDLKTDEE